MMVLKFENLKYLWKLYDTAIFKYKKGTKMIAFDIEEKL